jgi:beta-lactamase regulating signal transducer with metallopeptidase domain
MQRLMRFLAIVVATLAPPTGSSAQSAQQKLNGTTTSLQRVAGTVPLWVWIVLAVVVVLLVMLAVVRRRRSQVVIKTRLG